MIRQAFGLGVLVFIGGTILVRTAGGSGSAFTLGFWLMVIRSIWAAASVAVPRLYQDCGNKVSL